MSNLYALLLSLGLVVVVILSSELLVKLLHVPKEESRKFIHIGVSHWWLLAMFTMDSWRWAIIPPIIFIVLNLISWWTGMFSAMERKPRDPANLGTVYFPITLLILVILTWQDSPVLTGLNPYLGALGVMAMGYGDGFAALIGSKHGRRKWNFLNSTKSVEGSIAMFLAALLPLFLILATNIGMGQPLFIVAVAVLLSALATVVEAVTPWGLDNLTVPFTVVAVAYIILF